MNAGYEEHATALSKVLGQEAYLKSLSDELENEKVNNLELARHMRNAAMRLEGFMMEWADLGASEKENDFFRAATDISHDLLRWAAMYEMNDMFNVFGYDQLAKNYKEIKLPNDNDTDIDSKG